MEQKFSKEEWDILKQDISVIITNISPFGIWIVDETNPVIAKGVFTFDRVNTLISYLTDYGHAIYRLDLISNPNIEHYVYIQLTDAGRELKALGSIDLYNDHLYQKSQDKFNLENDRKRDFQRNEYQFVVNVCIAIATGVAALYYIWQFLKEYWSDYEFSTPRFCLFLLGIFTGILVLWIAQKIYKLRTRVT